MRLGDLLNVSELKRLISEKYVSRRNHPTLPIAILNYTNECMFQNYWPEEAQHCRGLIVNPRPNHDLCDDCEIVSRPFHKFFGLNHPGQEDYKESNLPRVPFTVTEKMDGWFGIGWKCGDTYGIASRGSFTSPGALFATQKIQKLVKYGAINEFPKGYSCIYEIIFKDGKIVVDYPFEGLVLLGCVNIETGEELPYDELQLIWAKIAGYAKDNRPWIRLVKAHRMSLDDCLTDSKENTEGYVLTYPRPGTWPIKVKIKTAEYRRLHKLITGVTAQQIWEVLHDPMRPWTGEGIPDHFRSWSTSWRDVLYTKFHRKLQEVQNIISWLPVPLVVTDSSKELDKEQFQMLNNRDPKLAPIAMYLIRGKIYDAYQAIWNSIRPAGRESDVFYREGQGE